MFVKVGGLQEVFDSFNKITTPVPFSMNNCTRRELNVHVWYASETQEPEQIKRNVFKKEIEQVYHYRERQS